jgi:hypothetical protein
MGELLSEAVYIRKRTGVKRLVDKEINTGYSGPRTMPLAGASSPFRAAAVLKSVNRCKTIGPPALKE